MSALSDSANDRWSSAEDRVLQAAVMKYGTNQWNRVASLLPRKTAAQSRSRWFEHLDPAILARSWTSAEDSLLRELQSRMPNMWRSIGAALGGRTAQQSYDRWQQLQNRDKQQQQFDQDTEEPQESSEVEPRGHEDRQLLAEARARLSNSLGRKAKRKQRERLEEERAFEESLRKHRKTGEAIKSKPRGNTLSSPQIVPPHSNETRLLTSSSSLPSSTSSRISKHGIIHHQQQHQPQQPQQQLRKPNRPVLTLPPPQHDIEDENVPHYIASPELTAKVLEMFKRMPKPGEGITLVDLYVPEPSEESIEEEPLEMEESEVFDDEGEEVPVEDLEAARELVRVELLSMPLRSPSPEPKRRTLPQEIIDTLALRESLFVQIRAAAKNAEPAVSRHGTDI